MPDITTILAEIEDHRRRRAVLSEPTATSVLRMVQNRTQLGQLFAEVPGTEEIVERADRLLRHTLPVERSDADLVKAATGHLRELRLLMDRVPAPDGAAELVDAFLALPCVVVNPGDDLSANAVELRGSGEEVTRLPDRNRVP